MSICMISYFKDLTEFALLQTLICTYTVCCHYSKTYCNRIIFRQTVNILHLVRTIFGGLPIFLLFSMDLIQLLNQIHSFTHLKTHIWQFSCFGREISAAKGAEKNTVKLTYYIWRYILFSAFGGWLPPPNQVHS